MVALVICFAVYVCVLLCVWYCDLMLGFNSVVIVFVFSFYDLFVIRLLYWFGLMRIA